MKKLFLLISAMTFLLVLSGIALANDVGYGIPENINTSAASSGAVADLSLTQNSSKIPMSVIGQDLKFPQLIPYFGPDNPGSRFRPLHDILLYGNEFRIGDLQKGISARAFTENQMTKVTNPAALEETITVIFNMKNGNGSTPDEGYQRMGYVSAKAVGEFTSLDAFSIMLLLANKMGAKVVHLTRQGVDFSMYAVGYGVSLGGVTGTLSESQQSGAVAAGMIGWAKGKSGATKDPWIQGIALEPRI